MTARTLMIQGTCSSAGKSLLTAALCRIYHREGLRVVPFKAQNMSNNAAVCTDGGEIGRSQAFQALACGIEPDVRMNPVLLKPEADSRSQIIVNGKPWNNLDARDYFERSQRLWNEITTALDSLRAEYDLVIMEGAGSPAELNLQQYDLVNMRVARYAEAPVLLVGNIELGGIFAQLLGTLDLLSLEDRQQVRGLIVNKFRGDQSLFDDGVSILEERSGIPVLGVVPWVPDLNLPEEDAAPVQETRVPATVDSNVLDVAVIYFPRISNLDDVDALRSESNVQIRFVKSTRQLGYPDVILLPGTKSTVDDLLWLRETGLSAAIVAAAESGAEVIGLCGGYQMLGERIENPQRLESEIAAAEGLGLLPVTTTFEAGDKQTRLTSAEVLESSPIPGTEGMTITGYEIHQGISASPNGWLQIEGQSSLCGSSNADNSVWGCYLHGLFHNDDFRSAWRDSIFTRKGLSIDRLSSLSFADLTERELDRLADEVEKALGIEALMKLINREQEAVS
ncbi:MAG: cobyric acid synthase [Planctomycetaceae bacterium]|nr:cobyric acid synthase [Planctomycetaceae bacterium]